MRFEPVTPGRWKDLAQLFGERGACGGCWCMAWRKKRSEWERDKGSANRTSLKALVDKGAAPGILAYTDGQPMGWCAVAPRAAYTFLERSRVLRRVDDAPVWSISCLFVAKPFRRQGVSVRLLRAAVDFAAARGGKIVEGYPVEPKKGKLPDPFVWTGTLSAFLQAGFREVKRHSPGRPIVRAMT